MKLMLYIMLGLMLIGCEQRRQIEVCEFPAGFRGWTIIVWGVNGYPPLPTVEGKVIERFPADGIIITSSKQQFGWAKDEAYFVDAMGHRLQSRPNVSVGSVGEIRESERSMHYSQQFIGTEAELRASPGDAAQVETLFSRLYSPPNTTLAPIRNYFTVVTNK